jgi:hypothetical protein
MQHIRYSFWPSTAVMHKFFARNVILYVHPLFNKLFELCSFVATVMCHCILGSKRGWTWNSVFWSPSCLYVSSCCPSKYCTCTTVYFVRRLGPNQKESVRKDINHVTSPNRFNCRWNRHLQTTGKHLFVFCTLNFSMQPNNWGGE